ncbi:MAG: hypothetical protein WD060_08915 [Pirellulales bacterium]
MIAVDTNLLVYAHREDSEWHARAKAWLGSSGLHLLHEGTGYLDKLERLCGRAKVAGEKIHDARIAAICLTRRHRTVDRRP